MKNYILKSLIIFIMVLTLGLILMPLVPTEKEVIESDFSFDLVFDVSVDNYYYNDNFDLLSYGYSFYFYQFDTYDNNSIMSEFFNIDNGGSVGFINIDADELEIDEAGYFRLWGVSK